ncbi:hypothetical protein F5Y16DRAFT_379830 [Xylariaceae sp. FL0255]|nr:hypothetical protein F5Y16DRAFT_379830 [Xylariaceae sp. FL0255]
MPISVQKCKTRLFYCSFVVSCFFLPKASDVRSHIPKKRVAMTTYLSILARTVFILSQLSLLATGAAILVFNRNSPGTEDEELVENRYEEEVETTEWSSEFLVPWASAIYGAISAGIIVIILSTLWRVERAQKIIGTSWAQGNLRRTIFTWIIIASIFVILDIALAVKSGLDGWLPFVVEGAVGAAAGISVIALEVVRIVQKPKHEYDQFVLQRYDRDWAGTPPPPTYQQASGHRW